MSQALVKVSETTPLRQIARLMQMSGFEKIVLLNVLAGNPSNAGWEAADAQLELIKSEFRELCEDGVEKRNLHEVRDGIADMLVVLYGLAHRLGIDADKDLHEVVLSNLTKFDPAGEPEAIRATVAKYLALGVETVQIEAYDPLSGHDGDEGRLLYVSRSAYDQVGTDGKAYPKGKWLKSANFVEPEFSPLPVLVQEKLGLVTIHRGLGQHGFGKLVENTDEGMVVAALDSYTIGDLTINQGDLILIDQVVLPTEDIRFAAETVVDDAGLEPELVDANSEDDIPGSGADA